MEEIDPIPEDVKKKIIDQAREEGFRRQRPLTVLTSGQSPHFRSDFYAAFLPNVSLKAALPRLQELSVEAKLQMLTSELPAVRLGSRDSEEENDAVGFRFGNFAAMQFYGMLLSQGQGTWVVGRFQPSVFTVAIFGAWAALLAKSALSMVLGETQGSNNLVENIGFISALGSIFVFMSVLRGPSKQQVFACLDSLAETRE